jgi:hypothetical protein
MSAIIKVPSQKIGKKLKFNFFLQKDNFFEQGVTEVHVINLITNRILQNKHFLHSDSFLIKYCFYIFLTPNFLKISNMDLKVI